VTKVSHRSSGMEAYLGLHCPYQTESQFLVMSYDTEFFTSLFVYEAYTSKTIIRLTMNGRYCRAVKRMR
jgi:hypothetical protein